ncbi:MAG: hypothetical protein AAB359_08380, partial [Elusimicrobiota bacterium]
MRHVFLFVGLSLIIPAQRSAAAFQVKTIILEPLPAARLTMSAPPVSPLITRAPILGASFLMPVMNFSPKVQLQDAAHAAAGGFGNRASKAAVLGENMVPVKFRQWTTDEQIQEALRRYDRDSESFGTSPE